MACHKRSVAVMLAGFVLLVLGSLYLEHRVDIAALPAPGSKGPEVEAVQWCLIDHSYYQGPVDGRFGLETWRAVREFQQSKGLRADGVVDAQTRAALTSYEPVVPAGVGQVIYRSDVVELLARLIMGEAEGEPYLGKVAVGAVIVNRIKNAAFPSTLAGVVYQPLAFESVDKGTIWRPISDEARRAAEQCLAGWDPTHGAVYFWNPGKPVNPWVWSRNIITQIGQHLFAR